MGSILEPHSNILAPGKLQVPAGQFTIDWTNSLANGLIACWLPGSSFLDLAAGLGLVPQSAALLTTTVEGAGFSSQVSGSGAVTSTTLPSVFTSWTGFTLRWRGYYTSNLVAQGEFLAVTYDNVGTNAPFYVAGMREFSGLNGIQAIWNSGGTSFNSSTNAFTGAPRFLDLVTTFVVGGNVTGYLNGVVNGATNTFGGAGPTSTATSLVELNIENGFPARYSGGICNIAQIWNRALSADEVATLYIDPYGMIIPAEYDLPIMPLPPVFVLMPQACL